MPYADRLYRANINAVINGDSMVHTVWMQADQGNLQSNLTQLVAERVRDKWAQFISGGNDGSPSLAGLLSTGTRYTTVQAYKIDADGTASDVADAAFATTVKGSGTTGMPSHVALVVTLLTGAPGRSRRGRLYLGGFSSSTTLTTDGLLAGTAHTNLTTSAGKFYTALRDNVGNDLIRPVVVSPTLGTASKITTVQIGNVWDTMRSRRKARVEVRQAANVDA
jgi:hypothetical protein